MDVGLYGCFEIFNRNSIGKGKCFFNRQDGQVPVLLFVGWAVVRWLTGIGINGGSALDLGWSGDIIVIAFLAFITGGLHLDGLADTADGLFSSRPREKKLQIMRDSRIGAMGAIVLWVFLSLKVAFLGELSGLDKVKLLIFMPAVGRGLMVWSIVKFPYARESGLGRPAQGGDWRSLAVNASVLAASGFLFLGVYSLVIIVVVWVAVHLLSTFIPGPGRPYRGYIRCCMRVF